jgi:hypothetical protein
MKTFLKNCNILLSLSLMVGCQGYSVTGGPGRVVPASAQVEKEVSQAIVSVHSVYVAPVTFEQGVDADMALAEILTGAVRREAKQSLDIEVFDPEVAQQAFNGTNVQASMQEAREFGRSLGAEAILLTKVQRYVKRIGTAAAAEQGAHVAFTMELRSVTSNEIVWKGSYSFKDQALSQNFLRLGERVREEGRRGWWTAEQLFEKGAEELLNKLQNDRIQQFTKR